jgi:hypothetical protein
MASPLEKTQQQQVGEQESTVSRSTQRASPRAVHANIVNTCAHKYTRWMQKTGHSDNLTLAGSGLCIVAS